jgi:hypothetical protein
MPLDSAFLTLLALRMAITAAFVVSAAFITERSGPAIGALITTLPVSAGPSYVFLALDHDAGFVADTALSSLPVNAATVWLGLVYVNLAQRCGALASLAVAALVWGLLVAAIQTVDWGFGGGLLLNAVTFAICLPLLRRYQDVPMPAVARRWYDVPLRAALVAGLVAAVVVLSGRVGPRISGIIAIFPVVFTSMMLILHPRVGGRATAAVIAHGGRGLIGFGLGLAAIALTARPLGAAAALLLALAICVAWNFGLWWRARRRARLSLT